MSVDLLRSEGRDRLFRHALAHPVLTVLLCYAVTRLIALGALAFAAHVVQNPAGVGHLDPTLGDMFHLWDADWYHRIVTHGYPVPVPVDPETGRITYSAWAFFPAFPYLVKGVMVLGLSFPVASALVNVPLGALAAVLVWRVCSLATHAAPQADRDRLALVSACLWCLYPATGVMLLPYTEALAAALVVAAVLLLVRRRYLWVAVVAPVLGYTRAVAPALGIAVLTHLVLRWREERAAGTRPFEGQRGGVVAMLVATAASGLAWPVTVGVLTGIPMAFFEVQAAWGQQPQDGPFVLWFRWAWDARGLAAVLVMVALAGTYIALVLGRHGRWLPLEVRAWALAYPFFLLAVVRPITSMWRFMLLDFPLAALLASVAMRTSDGERVVRHWRRRVAVVSTVLVFGVFWWTSALVTYTPWSSSPP